MTSADEVPVAVGVPEVIYVAIRGKLPETTGTMASREKEAAALAMEALGDFYLIPAVCGRTC